MERDNGGDKMTQTIVLIGIILYLGVTNYIERQKAQSKRLLTKDEIASMGVPDPVNE